MLAQPTLYTAILAALGLDPKVVFAVLEARNGCAADMDPVTARQHIQIYLKGLTTSITKLSTAKHIETTAVPVATLFAWQFGGVLLSPPSSIDLAVLACGKDREVLESGLVLLDMDVDAFMGVFCGQIAVGMGLSGVLGGMDGALGALRKVSAE